MHYNLAARKPLICILLVACSVTLGAQKKNNSRWFHTIELALAKGKGDHTVAFSLEKSLSIGRRNKWEIGIGFRGTFYEGQNKEFFTAPAELAKGSKGPLILFKKRIKANLDTVLIANPKLQLYNVTANMAYRISRRLTTGFNIDLFGLSLGPNQTARFIHDAKSITTEARPTKLNFLKLDDNTVGSQNSEFFLLYDFKENWAFKVFYELQYIEYTTVTNIQTLHGMTNDRFHDIPKGGGIGISYYF